MSGLISRLWPSALVGLSFGRLKLSAPTSFELSQQPLRFLLRQSPSDQQHCHRRMLAEMMPARMMVLLPDLALPRTPT